MKRLFAIAVMFLAMAVLYANSDAAEKEILVAYLTHTGNTETVAKMISEQTGGELFRVQTAKSYPKEHREHTKVLQLEADNARPELSTHVQNMAQYDVIFLGYPIWRGTIPMALATFLEEYDMSGKTIIPFCTYQGSGLGRSPSDIAKYAPSATLLNGLAVRGSSVNGAKAEIEQWLKSIGFNSDKPMQKIVNAFDLYSEFKPNVQATSELYSGKNITVTGVVTYTGADIHNTPSVELSDTTGGKSYVLVVVNSYKQLEEISVGETITMSGNFHIFGSDDGVVLKQGEMKQKSN